MLSVTSQWVVGRQRLAQGLLHAGGEAGGGQRPLDKREGGQWECWGWVVQQVPPQDLEPAVCPLSGVDCPLALEVSEAVGKAVYRGPHRRGGGGKEGGGGEGGEGGGEGPESEIQSLGLT